MYIFIKKNILPLISGLLSTQHELARLYVQTRVSGHKNWLHDIHASLYGGSVPVYLVH